MSTAFADVKPFPGQNNQAAPIGHNRPPLDEMIVAEFTEGLDPALVKKIEELKAAGDRAGPCDSQDLAGRYGDFIKMVGAAVKAVEAERERHNRPILTAQRALKARADGMIEPLNTAATKVRNFLNEYVSKQNYIESIIQHIRNCGLGMIDGRPYPYPILIRELEEKVVVTEKDFGPRTAEVERLRVETLQHVREAMERAVERVSDKEEPVAPEPQPEAAQVKAEPVVARGDYGARVGTSTSWAHEIESVRRLPDRILKHARVIEALDKVIAAEVRGGAREIKGCRIWSEQKVAVR